MVSVARDDKLALSNSNFDFRIEVDWRFATHKSLANRIHMTYIIKALPTNDVHKKPLKGHIYMDGRTGNNKIQ